MESIHLVIFSTSGKFITKFNVLRCISLSETLFWTGGHGPNINHLKTYHSAPHETFQIPPPSLSPLKT